MSNDNSNMKKGIFIALLVLVIYIISLIVLWGPKVFVFIGYNSLFYIDNLFKIAIINPIAIWGIFGFFIGSIIGIIIAVKKLKLNPVLILFPLLTVSILFLILGFVNKPSVYSGTYSPPKSEIQQPPKSSFYITSNSTIIVRTKPSSKAKNLFKINKNDNIEVIEKGYYDKNNTEWYKINIEGYKSATNYKGDGYINSKHINNSISSELPETPKENSQQIVVEKVEEENVSPNSHLIIKGIRVNVRSSPSLTAKVIIQLNTGDDCEIIGQSDLEDVNGLTDYWYSIKYKDITGWVFGAFTNIKYSNASQDPNSNNSYPE